MADRKAMEFVESKGYTINSGTDISSYSACKLMDEFSEQQNLHLLKEIDKLNQKLAYEEACNWTTKLHSANQQIHDLVEIIKYCRENIDKIPSGVIYRTLEQSINKYDFNPTDR